MSGVVVLLAGWVALLAAGCAVAPPETGTKSLSAVLYIGQEAVNWEQLVAANPMAPDESIKGVELSQRPSVSHFLVQIRDREQPHLHRDHDATITMLRGRGRLFLTGRTLIMETGDTVFIPRGTAHYYVSDSREPTVVLAIFTPQYDGSDAVVVPFEGPP